MFPILLITFASLCPFVLDYKQTQGRLSSTATMLLSSVSYKATIARLLPTVSYLTSLDKYSLGSIFIITLIFLYHALFAAFSAQINDVLAFKLDKSFLILFLSLILIKQYIYVSWLIRASNIRDKCKYEHAKNKTD